MLSRSGILSLCLLFRLAHLAKTVFSVWNKSHRWRNGYCARLECGRSWVRTPVGSNYKIGICCFFTKNASLRRKSKDWLARIRIMCPSGATRLSADCCFSELARGFLQYKNPTQRVGLVQSGPHHHLVYLFSPWNS